MEVHKRIKIGAASVVLILALMGFIGIRNVFAAEDQPPGPDRFTVIIQNYTTYEWWLTSQVNNAVICSMSVDHDGLPSGGDIYTICGQTIYDNWILTKACQQKDQCNGYYLQFIKSEPAERKVGVKQPPPEVWVTLEGCEPYKSTFRCNSLPKLVLTGEEPLEGEKITSLAGDVDGKPFTCDAICQLDLAPTQDSGMDLSFWAYSSYGDSSDKFTARIRVAKSADSADQLWYVDILSAQWRGDILTACSQIWDKFPPVGGNPDWLSTPNQPADLATNVSYEYLAANLIKQKVVDASSCADGGLDASGLANVCGVEQARPAVNDWQNRFDDIIFSTAQQTGVPAKLLEEYFCPRESILAGSKRWSS